MYKIADINPKNYNRILVYYDDKAEVNPYRVYEEHIERDKYGYPRKRKRLVVRYGNLASCTCLIADIIRDHDEENRA